MQKKLALNFTLRLYKLCFVAHFIWALLLFVVCLKCFLLFVLRPSSSSSNCFWWWSPAFLLNALILTSNLLSVFCFKFTMDIGLDFVLNSKIVLYKIVRIYCKLIDLSNVLLCKSVILISRHILSQIVIFWKLKCRNKPNWNWKLKQMHVDLCWFIMPWSSLMWPKDYLNICHIFYDNFLC